MQRGSPLPSSSDVAGEPALRRFRPQLLQAQIDQYGGEITKPDVHVALHHKRRTCATPRLSGSCAQTRLDRPYGHSLLDADAALGERDLRRALAVREALRALLLANNGEPISAAAVATLNRVADDACLVVRFGADGHSRLEPRAGGVDGALGRLLAIVNTAMTDGTWPRLKACRGHACRWAFYDASRNRSGAWCSMAVCGSRSKARTYRQRLRGQEPRA